MMKLGETFKFLGLAAGAHSMIEAVGGSILFGNSVAGGGEVKIILPMSAVIGRAGNS